MNSQRKAPMPQCSFQVHKGPSQFEKSTTNAGTVVLVAANSEKGDTTTTPSPLELMSSPMKTQRNKSPRSIILENNNDHSMKSPSSTKNNDNLIMSPSSRDISPMRKSKIKTMTTTSSSSPVRRSTSFDDSFSGNLSFSTNSPTTKTTLSPIRAGKRRDQRMLRCSSLPMRMKKNVSFDDKYDQIYEIERISDLSSDIIGDIWWSTEEYQNIKREYEAIIYLLDQNINMNEDEQQDSARGLHSRTEIGAWALFEKQRDARNAVLRQQELYKKQQQTKGRSVESNGMSIDVAIAKAYMDETLHLRDAAIEMAKRDYEMAIQGNGTNTLEESISDLSMLALMKSPSRKSPLKSPNKDRVTNIQSLRRTRSDNCFVDSMMIHHNTAAGTAALSSLTRSRSSESTRSQEQQQQPISPSKLTDHINNTSVSVLFECSSLEQRSKLTSVFEESILNLSDDDDDDDEDDDEEEGDGKTQSDDDVRSTDTNPLLSNLQYHVATKVRFAKKTHKMKGIKVKNIEADTKKRWYSQAELLEIASDVNAIVETIEKEGKGPSSMVVDGESVPEKTRRGLEKSTELGAKKLYDRRRKAWNAVLTAQRQNDNNENTDVKMTSIADAYIGATKEAQQEAIKFGKQDAKDARKYRIKRRSTASDHNSNDRSITDHITNSKSSQLKSNDDEEGNKSVKSDDSMNGLLNAPSYSADDCCNHSMRSLLNLDTDSVRSTESIGSSGTNCADYCNISEHRLSESHAPNRRFVQDATASLNRHIKMTESKQQQSSISLGPLRNGKPFLSHPYDISIQRDDSTNNDESEGNGNLLIPLKEESLQTRLASLQKVKVGDVFSSTCTNTIQTPAALNGESVSSTGTTTHCQKDNNGDSFVLFKVKLSDVKQMTLKDGSVVYLLRSAEKLDNRHSV